MLKRYNEQMASVSGHKYIEPMDPSKYSSTSLPYFLAFHKRETLNLNSPYDCFMKQMPGEKGNSVFTGALSEITIIRYQQ